jgi:predicted HTH transcriptional regulator
MHFHGTEVRKPIPSYQIYKGNVFELVDQAIDFVLSKLARNVGTRATTTQAPVKYDLPREAVAEAIVNAVAHRDYASNASVQVMLFADRLEVWNPGELPRPLTPALLRGPHPSIPRSPLLAEALFLARYIEKAGTGTLDMIARLKSSGLPEPEFVQEGGMFVQRLRRPRPVKPKGPAPRPKVRSESRSESKARWWRQRREWRTEWGPGSVHDRIMVAIEKRPRSRLEIARTLGHQAISGALRHALDDLMRLRLVAYTIPQKPGSRFQRYRVVSKPPGGRK